jgi:hypothetical protein
MNNIDRMEAHYTMVREIVKAATLEMLSTGCGPDCARAAIADGYAAGYAAHGQDSKQSEAGH